MFSVYRLREKYAQISAPKHHGYTGSLAFLLLRVLYGARASYLLRFWLDNAGQNNLATLQFLPRGIS